QYGGVDAQGGVAATDPTYMAYGGIPPPDVGVWTGSVPAVVSHAQEGYLNMDIIDARNKKVLWRGKGKNDLGYENKEKALKQGEKAGEKMVRKVPAKAVKLHSIRLFRRFPARKPRRD